MKDLLTSLSTASAAAVAVSLTNYSSVVSNFETTLPSDQFNSFDKARDLGWLFETLDELTGDVVLRSQKNKRKFMSIASDGKAKRI